MIGSVVNRAICRHWISQLQAGQGSRALDSCDGEGTVIADGLSDDTWLGNLWWRLVQGVLVGVYVM